MFPCASCERYLHPGTAACPFCGSQVAEPPTAGDSEALAPDAKLAGAKVTGRPQLSRAASYAVRAALVAAPGALLNCSDSAAEPNGDTTQTATSGGSTSTSTSTSSTSTDTGSTSTTAAATGSGGNVAILIDSTTTDGADGGEAGDVSIPIYGGPFPDMSEAKV